MQNNLDHEHLSQKGIKWWNNEACGSCRSSNIYFTCFVSVNKTHFKYIIKIYIELTTLSWSSFYTITDLSKYYKLSWFWNKNAFPLLKLKHNCIMCSKWTRCTIITLLYDWS
jgi:hypothetical protein